MHRTTSIMIMLISLTAVAFCNAQTRKDPELFSVPPIRSSWDDLMHGIKTPEDWHQRRQVLRQRYLDLIRDQFKPEKPPLHLKVHETKVVDQTYTRKLMSRQLIYGWMDTHLKPPQATETHLVSE